MRLEGNLLFKEWRLSDLNVVMVFRTETYGIQESIVSERVETRSFILPPNILCGTFGILLSTIFLFVSFTIHLGKHHFYPRLGQVRMHPVLKVLPRGLFVDPVGSFSTLTWFDIQSLPSGVGAVLGTIWNNNHDSFVGPNFLFRRLV